MGGTGNGMPVHYFLCDFLLSLFQIITKSYIVRWQNTKLVTKSICFIQKIMYNNTIRSITVAPKKWNHIYGISNFFILDQNVINSYQWKGLSKVGKFCRYTGPDYWYSERSIQDEGVCVNWYDLQGFKVARISTAIFLFHWTVAYLYLLWMFRSWTKQRKGKLRGELAALLSFVQM